MVDTLLLIPAIVGSLIIAAFAVFCIVSGIKSKKEKNSSDEKPKSNTEFFKKVIGWFIINSTVWIYMSYFLAYIGKVDIAESLSKQVVLSVIGVVVSYAAKSLIENLSKHNNWPDKQNNIYDETYSRDIVDDSDYDNYHNYYDDDIDDRTI